MIKYAVFDLDGTLLDTITTITYYVNLALSSENIEKISEDECKYFVGNGARLLIRRALESRGAYDEEAYGRVWEIYNREYNRNTLYLTAPYDGIPELISALKERGITLAVLSNKPDFATRDIIPSFFGEAFATVHGARDNIALKPMPDGVYEICRELGATPDQIMYLGDSGVDMQTGKNSGAALTVGVSWGFRTKAELFENGADVVVDSPIEILDLIK